MSIEIGELKARMTAEAQEIKAEIKEVKQGITDLGEQGKRASKDLDPLNKILEQIGLNTEQLKKIEEQLKKIDSGKVEQGLSEIVNELKKMGAESKQVSAVEKSLIEVTVAAQEANARITKLEEELRQAGSTGQKEATAISADLAKVGDEGSKAATSIKGLKTAITDASTAKNQIETLALTLDNINSRIELQRRKLAELKESYATTFNEAKKSKLEEQILKTEASLIKLTQSSDQTAQKMWALEDALIQIGQGGTEAASKMDVLDSTLKEIGLNAEQIKVVKKHLDETDPTKLERQLNELSVALKKLGVDSQQIEKITNELRQTEQEAEKTKKSFSGLSSGLAALGAGVATAKLKNVITTFAKEANELSTSFTGLAQTSKSLNVNAEESVELAERLANRWGLNKGVMAETIQTYTSMNLSLEETEKIITATADAAAYGRQKHLAWDEAIRQVAQGIKAGNSNLTDAAGITTNLSVMYDRYARSIGTTAAKLTEAQKVQAAYNGMMQEATIFAGNADSAMTGYTGTQATFNQTLEMTRVELGEAFLPLLQELMEQVTPVIKEFSLWVSENKEVAAGLAAAAISVSGLITVVTSLITVVAALRMAFIALNLSMGPIGWAIAIISTIAVGFTAYSAAADTAAESVMTFAKNQEELNKRLNESAVDRNVAEVQKLQESADKLNSLLEQQIELEKELNEIIERRERRAENSDDHRRVGEINDELAKINKTLKSMDFKNVDEASAALKRMNEEINKSVPALLEMMKAELQDLATKNDKIVALEKSVERYKELAAAQRLDEAQKQELIQITNSLKKQYPDLNAFMDEEGRIRIENINTIEQQIGVEKQLMQASIDSARTQLLNLQQTAAANKKSVEAQIKNYTALISVANAVAGITGTGMKKEPSVLNQVNPTVANWVKKHGEEAAENLPQAYDDQNKWAAAELEAKRALARLDSGGIDAFRYEPPDYGGGADDKKKKSKKKTGKSAAELAKEARKEAYDFAVATVQYQAEMYDWTAEQQIEAYEKIRKQHQQHLKETIEDERQLNLQLKRLREDSVRSRYEFSVEWIGKETRRMEESGKAEIEIAQMKLDAWTRVRDRYDKNTEYYKQADEQIYQNRKALISAIEKEMKELFSSSSDFLKQEERKMEESGASETEIAQMKLELWTRIRDSYGKDSEYYKQADEQVYQARKALISRIQKDAEEARKVEKKAIDEAKKADLAAIEERRKAYTDDIDERIAAIDRLIKAEDRLNAQEDYETLLAEKKARQAKLADAVSPEGRKEYAEITKEIERMELEHSRDIRKQNLEDQKEALQDEKSERERAFDKEKKETEAHYDSLTSALESHQTDVSLITTAINDNRIDTGRLANEQILADLDTFISEYNRRLASLAAISGPSQADLDLQEYNANKDAWKAAKAAGNTTEMAKLNARNEEIRKRYGITEDTGKLDRLPSFDVGGVVPGPIGAPMQAIIHGGEVIFNPGQFENMFRRLTAPIVSPALNRPAVPTQHIENHFDMSIGTVAIEDQADAEILYTERERTARRLVATGGGK